MAWLRPLAGLLLLGGAAALGAARQPVEDKHFMANTYGFLRSTKDSVGEAVQGVLEVQSSLDEMKHDLASEYDKWMRKKKDLTTENERLRSGIARMEAAKKDQASMREHVIRLAAELTSLQQGTQQIVDGTQKDKAFADKTRADIQKQIGALEVQLKEAQKLKAEQDAAHVNADSIARTEIRALQAQVVALTQKVEAKEAEVEHHQAVAAQNHSVLLTESDKLQAQLDDLQRKKVSQAEVLQNVEVLRRRVTEQANQVVSQKKATETVKANCVAKKWEMEQQIAEAKKNIGQANAVIQDCQNVDAKNQELQAQLNGCNAMKRSQR